MNKLTRTHKIYIAVLAVALIALVTDQLLLGPQEASADQAPAPATTDTPAGVLPIDAPVSPHDIVVPQRHLASRLRAVAHERGLDPMTVRDPFRIPAHWIPDEPTSEATPTEDLAPSERFARDHRLNAVMANAEGGYAIVDGRRLRLGRILDGFTLVAVRPRSIVLESDGVQVVLSLSDGGAVNRPD